MTEDPQQAQPKPGSRDGLAALAIVILAGVLIALAINKII